MKVIKAALLLLKFFSLTGRGHSILKLSIFCSLLPFKAQKLRSLEYRFLVFFLHKARHPESFYLSLLPGLRRYLIFFLEPVFIVPLLPCIFLVSSLKYKTGVLTLQAAMLYGVKIKSGAEPENVMNLCLY